MPRITYANVTSTIALFLALGGTSYAVASLPKNSVGTKQLKAKAVTTDKLADGVAISGPRGPRGPQGPAGPGGADGEARLIQVRRDNTVQLDPAKAGGVIAATVNLPPGSWRLDGMATITYGPSTAGSEWFSCAIQGGGQTAAASTARVGSDAGAMQSVPFALAGGMTVTSATAVSLVCAHPSAINGAPTARDVRLLATPLGSLEDR
jgi:hypothetical protein